MIKHKVYDTCQLESQLHSCDTHLHALNQQTKAAAKALAVARRTVRRQIDHAMTAAFVLYVQAAGYHGYDLEYLKRRWATVLDLDLVKAETEIEQRFLDTDVSELRRIMDGTSTIFPNRIFNETANFKKDADAYEWICEVNCNQGLAPTPKLVMLFRRGGAEAVSMNSLEEGKRLVWRAGERKWVQRFRQRWNLCLGRLPAGDVVPLRSMRQKARDSERWNSQGPRSAIIASRPVPKGGPNSGPHSGDHVLIL